MVIYVFCITFLRKTEKLNLRSADEYKYLRQSGCFSISGVDDAEQFGIVMVDF